MTDVVVPLIAMLGTCAAMALGYVLLRHFTLDSAAYEFKTASGRSYAYVAGNNLFAYPVFGRFNGFDIRLDIQLPHIYLDSQISGGHHVNVLFDPGQRISLEGDFDSYFAVFVPSGFEAVALSILSPDVMQTLKGSAAAFDVELYSDHLRIITDRRISKQPASHAVMLSAARQILTEVEHRQRSWLEQNSLESVGQDLHIYPSRGIRVMGHYFSWKLFWASIWWLACVLGILAAGLWVVINGNVGTGLLIICGGLVLGVLLQVMTIQLEKSVRFWSRGSQRL